MFQSVSKKSSMYNENDVPSGKRKNGTSVRMCDRITLAG
jgi:hypothetical protein